MITSNPSQIGVEPSFDFCGVAEMLRAAASRVYSETLLDSPDEFSCHRNRIISLVKSRLGNGLACNIDREQLGQIFEILLKIGDFAHVGNGHYVPRESRVVKFLDGWGRIAGGLPLEYASLSGRAIEDHLESVPSIGRMAKLAFSESNAPNEWEVHETYFWSKADDQTLFNHLASNSLGLASSKPTDACMYYNSGRRGQSRRDRWRNDPVMSDGFVVARKLGSVAAYFILLRDGRQSVEWFDITPDEARKWILLSERISKTKNSIRVARELENLTLFVPNMLPAFSLVPLFSCACGITVMEKGWEVKIDNRLSDFVYTICACNNLVIL